MLNLKQTSLLNYGHGDRLYPRDVVKLARLPFNRAKVSVKVDHSAQKMLKDINIADLSINMPIPAVTVFAAFRKAPLLTFDRRKQMLKLHYNGQIASCDLLDAFGIASGGVLVNDKMAETMIFASQQFSFYGDCWFDPETFRIAEQKLRLTKADLKVIDQDGYEDPAVTNNYFPAPAMKLMKSEQMSKNSELTSMFFDVKRYLGIEYSKDQQDVKIGLDEDDDQFAAGLNGVQEIKDELMKESSKMPENYFD